MLQKKSPGWTHGQGRSGMVGTPLVIVKKGKEGMEPDDLLCSRNARPEKDKEGSGQVPFLLAERAR